MVVLNIAQPLVTPLTLELIENTGATDGPYIPPVWILETGSWVDTGRWIDTETWKDGP